MNKKPGEVPTSLELFIDGYLPSIETEMGSVVQAYERDMGDLSNMLRYHLGWVDAAFRASDGRSGKRLRPILCLLACRGCGGETDRVLPAAAAVELLHNFTLIHDDIEDGDEQRRGRLTVWKLWGEAQGINAGDALFSISQLAMLRLSERDVPAEIVVEAMRLLNQTCVTLTRGQFLDIGFEGRNRVSVDEYLRMIEAKTAALIGTACEMGALIGTRDGEKRDHLRGFGRHAGLAFQMQDDVLGIWGDPKVTGKPVGADVLRRKKTLPLVHGLEQSGELRSLLAEGRPSEADLPRIRCLLDEVGSRRYAERSAREHCERALRALDAAALDSPAADALQELATKLIRRDH